MSEIEQVLLLYAQFEASTEPTIVTKGHYAQYSETAEALIKALHQSYWYPEYYPQATREAPLEKLETGDFIEQATLQEIKSYITKLIYINRFAEGSIAHILDSGFMGRIMKRLAILNSEDSKNRSPF